MDLDALLEHAKAGRPLPSADLETLRLQLASPAPAVDPYTLLHILGKAGDRASRTLVEKYLDYGLEGDQEIEGSDLVRRMAMQVLGRMWGIPEYFAVATHKVIHDPSPYVRSAAATIVGYLGARQAQHREQAAALLLEGVQHRDEACVWESCYFGLLELLQVPPKEWPSATRALRPQDVRPEVLATAAGFVAAATK